MKCQQTLVFSLSAEEKALQEQENMEILASMGLPLPGSGIHIIPRAMLNLTEEQLIQGAKEDQETRAKGYINRYTNRPRELLGLQSTIAKNHLLQKNPLTQESTALRANLKEIPLGQQKCYTMNHGNQI